MVPQGVLFFDSFEMGYLVFSFCPWQKPGRSNFHCAKAEPGFHEEASNSLSSAESQERQRECLEEEVDSGTNCRME